MLRRLFFKDLRLNPHLFWGSVPFFVWIAYALGEGGAPIGMLTVVSSLMGAMTAATVAAREDRFHAIALLASLPVPRATLVLSRYVLAAAAGVAAYGVAAALAALAPWSRHEIAAIFDPRTAMLALVIVGTSVAWLLPMALRFGLAGVVVFFGVLQVLGVGLYFLSSAFGYRQPMRAVFGGAESGLLALHARLSDPTVAAPVLLLVGALIWASYRTAVWTAGRRDL
jgi:hypothetical protein